MRFDRDLVVQHFTGLAHGKRDLEEHVGWFGAFGKQRLIKRVEKLDHQTFVGEPGDDVAQPVVFEGCLCSQSQKNVLDFLEHLIFTHRRTDDANADGTTAISVEYGSDLTGWTTAVAGADIVITETDDGFGAGIDSVEVKIRRTLAVGGILVARLNVVVTP